MPVQSSRRERPLIELFLTEYDNGLFRGCSFEWLEDTHDGAVEVRATSPSGQSVAIEHTLIQPFVGEKQDSDRFLKAFQRIEEDPSPVVLEHEVDISIPVGALPTGYVWTAIGEEVRVWLASNIRSLPEGSSQQICMVGRKSKKKPFPLHLNVHVTSVPGMPGACRIARYEVPGDLGGVVERALESKLPKLLNTPADRHILLLERDQWIVNELQIYKQIEKREESFPDLKRLDEIWYANTAVFYTEKYLTFELIDRGGLVELLTFQDGVLTQRRNDRR